jgi:hypothetical protein
MKTLNILKACVAVALVAIGAVPAMAQEVPKTAVGQTRLVETNTHYSVWEERLADPAPGFRAYNVLLQVNAGGAPGRFINAFQDLDIAGVHQIWEAPTRPGRPPVETPYPAYFEGFADELQKLDSSIGWTSEDESNGAAPTETNNGQNPAGVDPEVVDPSSGLAAADLVIGVGNMGVIDRAGGVAAALGLAIRPETLNVGRVVLWDGLSGGYVKATLSGDIGGEGDGVESNGGEIDRFTSVLIGDTMIVPEPAMGLMALIGSFGMLRLRRRVR